MTSQRASSWYPRGTDLPAEADDVLPQLSGLALVAPPQRLSQHALLPLGGGGLTERRPLLAGGVAGQAVL